jgi:hypothetical protein
MTKPEAAFGNFVNAPEKGEESSKDTATKFGTNTCKPKLCSHLTPRRRIVLEKPIVAKLLEYFLAFIQAKSSLPCSKNPVSLPIQVGIEVLEGFLR